MEQAPARSPKSHIDIHPATRYLNKNTDFNEKEVENTNFQKIVQPHLNLTKALMCGIAFLFLLASLNSAQNCQNKLFEVDNYGNLGFYSNGVV
jgi:uncharacterized membrane protein SirB2